MLGYLLLFFLTSPSCTQNDLDPDLIVCFESVSKLKTLRFKSTLYSNRFTRVSPNQKSLDGLWEAKNAEGIIDLPSGWFRFKESMYDDKHGKCLNRSRSWCDGELRAFTDINSPILEAANLVAPGGTIDLEPLDYAALPPVPRSQLGFGVTAVAGDLADLWDLAIQNPPVKIRENTYEIRNVFGWKPDFGSAYDLYFELSPQHGYLPRLIKILDRTLDGSVPTTTLLEREVNRFAKINSLELPVDFTYRVGKTVERTILDHDSLVINETFSKDDFALQMPIDNWYYDYRTKTRFDPKLITSTKISWNWLWSIVGAVIVTLIIAFLKLRKRTLVGGLLAVCATSLGCGKNLASREVGDSPGAQSKQSSVSAASPVLEINNGLPIQVRIPIEQREGKVIFPIKNCSEYALTFNSDFRQCFHRKRSFKFHSLLLSRAIGI